MVLFSVVLGSFAYRLVIGIALVLGLPATDLKLITAILVIIALATPTIRTKLKFGV